MEGAERPDYGRGLGEVVVTGEGGTPRQREASHISHKAGRRGSIQQSSDSASESPSHQDWNNLHVLHSVLGACVNGGAANICVGHGERIGHQKRSVVCTQFSSTVGSSGKQKQSSSGGDLWPIFKSYIKNNVKSIALISSKHGFLVLSCLRGVVDETKT